MVHIGGKIAHGVSATSVRRSIGVGGMNSKTVVEVALFFIEFEVYNGLLIDIV